MCVLKSMQSPHCTHSNMKLEIIIPNLNLISRFAGISAAAGGALPAEDLINDLMNGDFEIDEWDKKMLAAYGDDYYDVGYCGHPCIMQGLSMECLLAKHSVFASRFGEGCSVK